MYIDSISKYENELTEIVTNASSHLIIIVTFQNCLLYVFMQQISK